MKRLLSAMGITVSVARWVFVSSVVTLAVIVNFYLIFWETDTQLPAGTLVPTIVVATIALTILLLSAWLGYFKSGQALILSNQVASQRRQRTPTMVGQVLKTLFASFALAVGIFIVLDVVTLFTFGPKIVESTFDMFMTPIVGLLTPVGAGFFAGVGLQGGISKTKCPTKPGISVQHTLQGDANLGAGPFVGGSIQYDLDQGGGFQTGVGKIGAGYGFQLSGGVTQTVTIATPALFSGDPPCGCE